MNQSIHGGTASVNGLEQWICLNDRGGSVALQAAEFIWNFL